MAYSETESRIGCVNTDYSLSFWDLQDDFKFEKTFVVSENILNEQIYYIEFAGTWITVDQEANLYTWSLEAESCTKFPPDKKSYSDMPVKEKTKDNVKITKQVLTICEITQLRLIAVSILIKEEQLEVKDT
jgi:hypothetical protein